MKNEEEFEKVAAGPGPHHRLDQEAPAGQSLKVQQLVRPQGRPCGSRSPSRRSTQYLEENRAKLETGLTYHARHILLIPDAGHRDDGWEGARIKADMLRSQILQGPTSPSWPSSTPRDATAKDGGDLGTLKRGELSQDIEEAILVLKVERGVAAVHGPHSGTTCSGSNRRRRSTVTGWSESGSRSRHPLPREVRHAPRGRGSRRSGSEPSSTSGCESR